MKPIKQELAERIRRAAEARAAGVSWMSIAKELGTHYDTARRWRRNYPVVWRTALAEAEQSVMEEMTGESIFTLRKMLRDEDPKIQRDAARLLLNRDDRKRKPADNANEAAPTSEMQKIVAEMEKIDEAQLDSLVANLLQDLASRANGDPGHGIPEVGTT